MASVIAAITVAAIYFGRPIFVPIALAILIAFALSPLLRLLRKLKLGRVVSVVITVLFGVVVMIGLDREAQHQYLIHFVLWMISLTAVAGVSWWAAAYQRPPLIT